MNFVKKRKLCLLSQNRYHLFWHISPNGLSTIFGTRLTIHFILWQIKEIPFVFAEHRPMMKIMFCINLNFVKKENYVCRCKTGVICFICKHGKHKLYVHDGIKFKPYNVKLVMKISWFYTFPTTATPTQFSGRLHTRLIHKALYRGAVRTDIVAG